MQWVQPKKHQAKAPVPLREKDVLNLFSLLPVDKFRFLIINQFDFLFILIAEDPEKNNGKRMRNTTDQNDDDHSSVSSNNYDEDSREGIFDILEESPNEPSSQKTDFSNKMQIDRFS